MMNSIDIDIFDKEVIKDFSFATFGLIQCPTCLKVFGQAALLTCLSTPCPNCQTRDEIRQMFPYDGKGAVAILFKKIKDLYINEEKELVVILFCTFFEVLIGNFFRNFGEAQSIPYKVVDFLQDELTLNRQVNNMFKKIVGVKFKDAVQGVGYNNFYAEWDGLRQKRNSFVHGNPWDIEEGDCKLAWKLTIESFGLFTELNNAHCVKSV